MNPPTTGMVADFLPLRAWSTGAVVLPLKRCYFGLPEVSGLTRSVGGIQFPATQEMFMPETQTHLLKRWFEEVWNQGSEAAIDEMAAPDMVAHGLVDASGKPIAGREKFKEFWRLFREVFPDIQIEIEDSLTDGDKQIVRCTARGTHSGNGLGFVATHKPIKFTGMVIARVKDGQFVEAWDNWDFHGLYQQLGAALTSRG